MGVKPNMDTNNITNFRRYCMCHCELDMKIAEVILLIILISFCIFLIVYATSVDMPDNKTTNKTNTSEHEFRTYFYYNPALKMVMPYII